MPQSALARDYSTVTQSSTTLANHQVGVSSYSSSSADPPLPVVHKILHLRRPHWCKDWMVWFSSFGAQFFGCLLSISRYLSTLGSGTYPTGKRMLTLSTSRPSSRYCVFTFLLLLGIPWAAVGFLSSSYGLIELHLSHPSRSKCHMQALTVH